MERNHSQSQRSELSPRAATIVSPPLTAAEREDRYLSPLDRIKRANSPTAKDLFDEAFAAAEERRARDFIGVLDGMLARQDQQS